MPSVCVVRRSLSATVGLVVAGCKNESPGETGAAAAVPEVTVAHPTMRIVPDYAEYTGGTDALDSVDIRARVSGYLQKINFKAGDTVTTGQLLFQIDPDPFQADYDKAKAQVTGLDLRLDRLKKDVERYTILLPQKAVSQQDFDKAVADEAGDGRQHRWG